MAMYRILLLCFLLLSFIQFSHASDFDDVKTRVNQLQTSNPSLPSGGEQKGSIGTIVSKIFNDAGYIKNEFLDMLSSLNAGDVGSILKWNGNGIEKTVMTETGGNISISWSLYFPQNGNNIYMQGVPMFVYDTTVGDFEYGGIVSSLNSFFVGPNAWQNSTWGQRSAIGYFAGTDASGFNQTAVGFAAGYQSQWNFNTQIGAFAAQGNAWPNTAYHQTAIGFQAGSWNSWNAQIVVGSAAGFWNSGVNQAALWFNAGKNNSWDNQIALGFQSGFGNTGNNVSAIWYRAAYNNSGNEVLALWYRAWDGNTSNNKFIVHQRSVNSIPLLQWDFSTWYVWIWKTDASQKLDVAGNIKADGGIIVGNASTCNTAAAGMIRYNSSTNVHEGCNGTSWNALY